LDSRLHQRFIHIHCGRIYGIAALTVVRPFFEFI